MNKENISKKIAHFITLLSPLLIFAFKDQQYMVFVLPVISAILELFLDYYFSEKTFGLKTKDLPSIVISKEWNDPIPYNQICWYLMQQCKISKLELEKFHKEQWNERSDIDIPIYMMDDNAEFEFIHNNETVFALARRSENSTKKIILFSKSIEILKNLISECSIKYRNYMNQNKSRKYQLLTWSPKNHQHEWIPSPINVIKNRKNVFLSKKNSIIFDNVMKFNKSKQFYDDKGFIYKRGFLLHGLPGTGKSSAVYAIAYELNMNIYKLSLMGCNDSDLILSAKTIPPKSIVLIEDIDTIESMHNRDTKKEKKGISINLETILNLLDGYSYFAECLIFCTTNHINKLDPALIRHGRMDELYEFTYASLEQIEDITNFYEVPKLYNQYYNKQMTTAELTQICWAELQKNNI